LVWSAAWFGLLFLCLAGCDTPSRLAEADAALRIKPDPALLKVEPLSAEDRLPLKLALFVPPNLPGAVTVLPWMPGEWTNRKSNPGEISWKLETGSIVEQALVQTLSATLGEELAALSSAPAPEAGYSGRLELVSVQFSYNEELLNRIPPLAWIEFEVRTRMAMQMSLFDAQGQLVWTRYYDDGLRTGIWQTGGYDREGKVTWQKGIQRMAHDAAGRLAQQLTQDLREWYEAQRMVPRRL
jgi:hypothetical protein